MSESEGMSLAGRFQVFENLVVLEEELFPEVAGFVFETVGDARNEVVEIP